MGEYQETRVKISKKTDATTYFGCTVAPDDSCGAPARVVLPSDALPASSALPRWGDSGNAGLHSIPGRWGCRTR